MKKDHYLKSLQILVQELTNFQELLETTYKLSLGESLKTGDLEQIVNSVQNIKTMVSEAKRIKSLTLLNQDFSNFCLLLIDGSDMADYLLARHKTSKKIQSQARYWKDTAVQFKPFLKNSIYNRSDDTNSHELTI